MLILTQGLSDDSNNYAKLKIKIRPSCPWMTDQGQILFFDT